VLLMVSIPNRCGGISIPLEFVLPCPEELVSDGLRRTNTLILEEVTMAEGGGVTGVLRALYVYEGLN